MAAAVDDRDDDVPVVLPGLRFGRGHRLLGLIKRYRRAIVTNTFMNGRLRRSDAFAAGKFHVEPPSPSSFTSFDHLVGDSEQPWREAEAECLGGVEVDHELELDRLHDRQLAGLLALENPAGIDTSQAICIGDARSVTHQTADFGKLTQEIDRKNPMVSC